MNNYTLKVLMALVCAVAPLLLQARPAINTQPQQPRQLSFIENKGQITDQHGKARKDIDVKLSAGDLNVFIGDGAIHYQWCKSRDEEEPSKHLSPHERMDKMREQMMKPSVVDMYRMDVTLVGANTHAEVAKEEGQEYYERYYTARLGEDGALAHTFNKITYKNIYPNIDWVLYSRNNELKYDFIVHPGGNAADIKLKYGGATALTLEKGALTATTPHGNIAEDKPFTYDANTKQAIASSFVLNGNVLSFNVAMHNGTVVIDPTINWVTYYGGSDQDFVAGVAADRGGNSFLVGSSASTTNIATTAAYQTTLNGTTDGMLVKFSPEGARQWSTYYGGASSEFLFKGDCDAAGVIYVLGQTSSTSGIATSGSHQTTFGGPSTSSSQGDLILIKFNNAGARIWGTYYGGSDWEEAAGDVVVDNAGNVYMSGETGSTNNIATPGAHQTSMAGTQDVFLVKFNANGVRQWGTYFGGTKDEQWANLALDPSGNIYISGETSSTTGIATTGAHQTSLASLDDTYLAKFAPTGILQWGTYFGGNGWEWAWGLACDATANVYVSGSTYSSSGIATTGAYQTTIGSTGLSDCFLTKFNTSGARQWGTYYGGSDGDDFRGVAISSTGKIYTAGITTGSFGLATTGAYQTTSGGANDAFIVEWNSSGMRLWSSYLGGNNNETSNDVTWSPAGYLFIPGGTAATSGLSTSNAYQTQYGGGTSDAFLASFITDTMVYIRQPFQDTVLCPGDTIKLAYGVSYNFKTGNVFTAQLSNASGNFAIPVSIGTKTYSVGDTLICVIPPSTPPGSGYRIRIIASNPVCTSLDEGLDIRIKVGPASLNATGNTPLCEGVTLNLAANGNSPNPISYVWSGPLNFSSTNATNTIPNVTLAHAGDYIVKANDGQCTTADTVTVVVNTIPAIPTATIDSPICYGLTLNMGAVSTTAGVSYNWAGPNSFTSNQANPSIANATTANSGTYAVTATKAGCTSSAAAVTTLVYPKTPLPMVPDSAVQCVGSTLNIAPANIPGATYAWLGPNGFVSATQNINIPLVQLFHTGYYTVTAVLNGCSSDPDSVFAKINIKAKIGAYASPNDTVCAGTAMTYVAMQNNGGPSPVYQWYRNYLPISGANSLLYTSSNVTSGEKFHCTMYSVGVCDLPVTVSTDTIEMVVLPIVTKPSATITSNPVVPQPNELTVFTAHVQNGGPIPKYQWQLNGVDQVGATYATWSATVLRPFDKVNVVITSNDPCTNVKTAVSDTIMLGFPTGIAPAEKTEELSLYPNPNKGTFTIKGNVYINNETGIEVLNAVGQIVYRNTAQPKNGMLNAQINLPGNVPNGVYLLRINTSEQTKHVRFTLDR